MDIYTHFNKMLTIVVFKENTGSCDHRIGSDQKKGYADFWLKERPRPFCSDPRPRLGRHILAPRDPGDPATLPTLQWWPECSRPAGSGPDQGLGSTADPLPHHSSRRARPRAATAAGAARPQTAARAPPPLRRLAPLTSRAAICNRTAWRDGSRNLKVSADDAEPARVQSGSRLCDRN